MWMIYGKRTGLKNEHKVPTWDKTFRALNQKGKRVNRLADAYQYQTKEEAQAILDKTGTARNIADGLVVFEIRKVS